MIFSRVMYLLSADHIQLKDLFTYELSPVPTALFKDIGEGRSKASKAVLKNALKKVSVRNIFPDAILIDGCAMLHSAIHWPKGGKVEDLLAGLRSYISKKLLKSDVYRIFDRYKEFSIKPDQFRCSHTLSKTSPLPAKEVTLRVIKTKMQLIEMAKSDLMDNLPSAPNKLVITSQQDEPEQLLLGTRTLRPDLRSTHEEADVIIPHQVSAALTDGKSSIKVFCEDTDDFVLLCHCYQSNDCQVNLYLAEFSEGKSIISINDSVKTHNQLIPDSLSVHALTGCDSVPMMYGIGKKKAINVAKKSSLSYLGQLTANEEQYLQQSKQFIANCYGGKSESVTILDLNTTRQKTVLRTTTPETIATIKT